MTATRPRSPSADSDAKPPRTIVQDDAPDPIARALAEPTAWPADCGPVEWIQTHISHVFLTRDRVFKLRKAVQFPFLDFSTRAGRNADCENELLLNRRLAPSVYLGIAPIERDGDALRVGALRETLTSDDQEHVVVMRRLPAGRDALALAEAGLLESRHLERVARLLARFHAAHRLGVPAPWTPEEWLERITLPIAESVTAIAKSELIDEARLTRIQADLDARIESLRPRFESRRSQGCAVDGHGDLHLDHIWFEEADSEPLLIDCLEFDENLRKVDAASEIAFLVMDLRYRGRVDLAESFLSAYAMQTDDYDLLPIVDFFAAYRALVRAKVAALAAQQVAVPETQRAQARESAERHFALAEEFLATRNGGGIALLCGTVGSGKSTVARYLAATGSGIQVSSDRVRKHLLGVDPSTRLGDAPDEGAYRPQKIEAVYRALLDRAASIVASGRTAILDASFSCRAHRETAASWAAKRGLPATLIEVRCQSDTALERLARRQAQGQDPSDAGPDFLSISEARFERPDEWPTSDHVVVWTDRDDAQDPFR